MSDPSLDFRFHESKDWISFTYHGIFRVYYSINNTFHSVLGTKNTTVTKPEKLTIFREEFYKCIYLFTFIHDEQQQNKNLK